MGVSRIWPVFAAAVLSTSITSAQSRPQTSSATKVGESPITLVGCLQREADYRKAHNLGKGGGIGAGLGSGDEFVLINATRSGNGATSVDCSRDSAGDAYELTGKGEDTLKSFVGRAVQINGTVKSAKVDATTSRPTGGFDPLKQDLKLFEIDVASVEPFAPSAAGPAPSPAAAPTPAPRPRGTSGRAEALPKTASTLPTIGLLGLFAFGGLISLRVLRRNWELQ